MRCVLLLAGVFQFFFFPSRTSLSEESDVPSCPLSLSVFFSSDAQTKDNDREEKEEREENRERKRIHSTRSAISLSLSLFYFQRHVFAFEPNKNLERERKKETSHHRGDDADGGSEKKIQKKKRARARKAREFFTMRIAYLRQTGFNGKVAFFYVRVSTHFVSRSVFFLVARACFVCRNQ